MSDIKVLSQPTSAVNKKREKSLELVRFGSVVQHTREGFNPNSSGNEPYIGLEHIEQGTGRLLGRGRSENTQSLKTRFQKGQVLFGKLRPYLKKVARPDFEGVCSTEILVFSGVEDQIDNAYLFQLCQLESFIQHCMAGSEGTKMPRASWRAIKNYELILFPLEQQRKIAAILESVDDAIQKTQAVISQLKMVKRGLMGQLFTRGVPGWHSEFQVSAVGQYPTDWTLTTLGDLCGKDGLQTGLFGSQLKAAEYTEEGTPVVMPINLHLGRIYEEGIARVPQSVVIRLERHKVKYGDILFGRRGDIGRFGFVTDAEKDWLCGTGCLRARLGNAVRPYYLAAYLSRPEVSAWLVENAVGQTMLNLNTKILAGLPVLIPSEKEQELIAGNSVFLTNRLEAEQAKAKQLQTLKKGLMQGLLTGRMEVTA